MVKIIYPGIVPESKPRRCECSNCKSVLEFTPAEHAVQRINDQRGGDFYSLTCPFCAAKVTVSVGSRNPYANQTDIRPAGPPYR